jgi:hypothetical protein
LNFGRGKRFSSSPTPTQPPIQWVLVFFPGGGGLEKWLECEVNHKLHLVLRLRMTGAIPLLPLYAFMAWRENFTFLLHKRYKAASFQYILIAIKAFFYFLHGRIDSHMFEPF